MRSSIDKQCLDCGSALKGRSDKKFCNNFCRNNYNNTRNQNDVSSVVKINRILKRNRIVIKTLLEMKGEKESITKDALLQMDFNFKYYTSHLTDGCSDTYYCYDYAIKTLDSSGRSFHLIYCSAYF